MADLTPSPDVLAALAHASRELGLLVDESGTLLWSDARAQRLGLAAPGSLIALVVPGCEDKARELCREGIQHEVRRCELPLVVDGAPVTVVFGARPCTGGAALHGSLIEQDYASAIVEGNRAVHEFVGLNRELARQKLRLEESNTAIRALHGELAQQADRLRQSAEVKGRLVAGVSHEFRTPLHSILGLSRLLLSGSDGPLSGEHETQVRFIRDSAEELSRMINDMLDLSRLDAGSVLIRSEPFDLREFFSALRGTMNPLLADDAPVQLVFDPVPDVALETDPGKLSQILRNLISNAIKFTERGIIQITSSVHGEQLEIAVTDSGIGISPEDQPRVFEEFIQIDSPLQRTTRGTGLGLPLSNKLAENLGGTLGVTSTPGVGSTFTLTIPMEHAEVGRYRKIEAAGREVDPSRAPVLVVEDDRSTVFAYERYLSLAGFQVIPVRSTREARETLLRVRPSAILLDVMLDGEDTWTFLDDVKRNPATADIPVLVCTMMNRESRARALGADELWLKPIDEDRLIRKLQSLATGSSGGGKVLVVDDDPAVRYLIQRLLHGTPYQLIEAATGDTAIELARSERPDVILLDFLLEETTAFDVIDRLEADPSTRGVPVIVVTSQALSADDRERLGEYTEAILPKEHLSRELAITRIGDALRSAGITGNRQTGDPRRGGA